MIFFNVPEARQQLVTKGFVYTLRPKMRRTGEDVAVYGSYFKHERIGDVSIQFIKEVTGITDIIEYVSSSGFAKAEDWWKAANGSKFLFRVVLLEAVEAWTKTQDPHWLTVDELKAICRKKGLPDSGNKEDLIRRLK